MESTFIADAQFTKFIGVLKAWPYSLFDKYNGVVLKPHVKSTLFKDAAMLQPVTAIGDTVVAIQDQSGRANHIGSGNGTYQEVNGVGRVRFNGVNQGMKWLGAALEMFAGAEQGLVLIDGTFGTVNTFRTMLRFNVAGGNNPMVDFATPDPVALNFNARRTQADAVTTNSYSRIASQDIYAADFDWMTGRFDTYRNGGEKQSKVLPSTGALPAQAANGASLANYDNGRYAAMDFCGLIILAGAGDISSERPALEQWLRTVA